MTPYLTLHNGVKMPQLGLGTWPMNDDEATGAVAAAIGQGYRLIDTAENYGNESGVGAGIHQGIRQAGLKREEIFVTTKFNRQWHSVAGAKQACEASLKRMKLDYLDLLLIHWPNPDHNHYVEAYEGMVTLLQQGLVRAIGTSNFKPAHLQKLFERGFCPMVNQIQLDPYHDRDDLVMLHRQRNIVTETWRPLGAGSALLAEPAVMSLAQKYGRTPGQIVLRWAVQQGFVTIPKTAQPHRLRENIALFDFALTEAEMGVLTGLRRANPDMLDSDQFGH
ncbi:MAG: aldo/keto reductase [Candidatus Symbiobacter sp.]|nr:aldo/keto reductase [Candidatus Symbiobacter sp.]